MIADASSVGELFSNILVGVTGGNWLILALLVFIVIGLVLIYARARASLVLIVGVLLVFIFGLLDSSLTFLFWIIIIASLFLLIMGLRRWITSQ